MTTSFQQRISFMREAVRPLIEFAQKLKHSDDEQLAIFEASLLVDQAHPEIFDEIKLIADFPEDLSGEQLAYAVRIGYEIGSCYPGWKSPLA